MDKNALLSNISNHIHLTPEEEELLLSKIRLKKFLKGQYISQGGDISKYINFVISGSLKTRKAMNISLHLLLRIGGSEILEVLQLKNQPFIRFNASKTAS